MRSTHASQSFGPSGAASAGDCWHPVTVPKRPADPTPSDPDPPRGGDEPADATRGSWFGRMARGAGSKIDDALKSTRTARAIAEIEDRVWAFRRDQKIGRGTLRSTFVVAYRGYAANQLSTAKAYVRVRVMEEPVLPAADALPNSALLRANIRRFVALAFPAVRVRISMGDFVADAVTDRHGFATAQLPALDLEPGWVEYECQTMPTDPTEEPARATGHIVVPDAAAPIAIVSDVDDTVLRTGLSEGFVAIRNTLLRSAATRRAVPGMAELYRQIAEEHRTKGVAPASFYVSTGPWNLYDMLTDFLDIRGFPAGPLFLTDWAPQERFVVRSGSEHKRRTLTRLFEAYPDTKFILFGDSGQKDPTTYVDAARAAPDNVGAIVIRDVGQHMSERAAAIRDEEPRLREEGIEFHFASDAADAARALSSLGILPESSVSAVEASLAIDAQHPDDPDDPDDDDAGGPGATT